MRHNNLYNLFLLFFHMIFGEEMWRFWEGLNEGEIDWFALEHFGAEEYDQAIGILVDRGFLSYNCRGGFYWDVIGKDRVLNPEHKGKTLYFRGGSYATSYADFCTKEKGEKAQVR